MPVIKCFFISHEKTATNLRRDDTLLSFLLPGNTIPFYMRFKKRSIAMISFSLKGNTREEAGYLPYGFISLPDKSSKKAIRPPRNRQRYCLEIHLQHKHRH